MTNRFRVAVSCSLAAVIILVVAPVLAGSPEGVSPGAVDRVTEVEGRCPSFYWVGVPEATAYELVAYRLTDEQLTSTAEQLDLSASDEILYSRVPGGATAWQPELADGLDPGGNYVWFVRAVLREEAGEVVEAGDWSAARFFSVPATPSSMEVEAALDVLRRHLETGDGDIEIEALASRDRRPVAGAESRAEAASTKRASDLRSPITASAAIRGEQPDSSGEAYGVVGVSASPDGAGIGAVNTAGGPDLVLDGTEDGETDLLVSQSGVERDSTQIERFNFSNPGTGEIDVFVEGWTNSHEFVGGGSHLTDVDAETLDGVDSTGFSPSVHLHDDRYYTEGELNTSGGGGAVHWNNLSSVPVGLNDGDDDTTYTAGVGLELVGTQFRAMGSGFENLIVVATGGGDFTSIQTAIDSVTDAASDNPYLVWVAPGVYTGAVTLKPHVHLQGAGRGATIITSAVSTSGAPSAATVVLSADTSLRDLTAENTGSAYKHVAILAPLGTTRTLVRRVNAWVRGGPSFNTAVVVSGSGSLVTFENVTSTAEGASNTNLALRVMESAWVSLRGGSYSGVGGNVTGGIKMESGTTLTAIETVATAVFGGNFGRGLWNDGGTATLNGGSYSAYGGDFAYGVQVHGGGSLEAVNVAMLGIGGGNYSFGLNSIGPSTSILRGGFFHGSGGASARGINQDSPGATLEASQITALGEDGGNFSDGISTNGGTVTMHGGTLTGSGGTWARGFAVKGSAAVVEATNGKLTAKDASVNHSLNQTAGSVSLGVIQLTGSSYRSGGTLACFQVYDASFTAHTCP